MVSSCGYTWLLWQTCLRFALLSLEAGVQQEHLEIGQKVLCTELGLLDGAERVGFIALSLQMTQGCSVWGEGWWRNRLGVAFGVKSGKRGSCNFSAVTWQNLGLYHWALWTSLHGFCAVLSSFVVLYDKGTCLFSEMIKLCCRRCFSSFSEMKNLVPLKALGWRCQALWDFCQSAKQAAFAGRDSVSWGSGLLSPQAVKSPLAVPARWDGLQRCVLVM